MRVVPAPVKYSFHDDYSEGAHPEILAALAQTNMSQQSGYGDDKYCEDARKAIRSLIGNDANIYFTPGGTGANLLSIASHLRPHEAIIAAEPGHIVGKEGGCVEATGHKILVEPDKGGKLTPARIQSAFDKSSQFAYQPKGGPRPSKTSTTNKSASSRTSRGHQQPPTPRMYLLSLCFPIGVFVL